MIYDCFTFYNELELLELRLHELGGVVDKFVLVEARRTHTNKPKPLHFAENRDRFAAFADKIVHIVPEDMPDSKEAWDLENFQRNCISRGLRDCRPDDFVLISDIDEIPRAETVARISRAWVYRDDFLSKLAHGTLRSKWFTWVFHRKGLRRTLRHNHPFVLKFQQKLYRHYLNCQCVQPPWWFGTKMLRFRDFTTADEMRESGHKIVEDGGWHFSYMGGAERVQDKLAAYAHQERNLPHFNNLAVLSKQIEEGAPIANMNYQLKTVPLDGSFPRYLVENRAKFLGWLKEPA